ncbi:MAG: GHKL domain-containing protein, partial [Lachnospiraceae bacterium]|nr:GHKL domain-containing protein [Lachnospiraceae bacterium]
KYNRHSGEIIVNLEQKGEKAVISISNTGPGIDTVLIPRLFERFYREEQNRSSRIHGAGLGLAIIKHILSLYDGRISVKCNPNVITTFKVTI